MRCGGVLCGRMGWGQMCNSQLVDENILQTGMTREGKFDSHAHLKAMRYNGCVKTHAQYGPDWTTSTRVDLWEHCEAESVINNSVTVLHGSAGDHCFLQDDTENGDHDHQAAGQAVEGRGLHCERQSGEVHMVAGDFKSHLNPTHKLQKQVSTKTKSRPHENENESAARKSPVNGIHVLV